MEDKYILAIDGGTQSYKLTIFDLKGNPVSKGQQVLRPTESPELGFVEHPGDDLWDSLLPACKQVFQNFPGKPEQIIAVGLCTIRVCRAYLKKDGSLAYPILDWMDKRAYGPFTYPVDDVAYLTTSSGYMTHRLTGQFRDTVANYQPTQWPVEEDTWRWSDNPAVFEGWNCRREMMFEQVEPGEVLGTITREASEATGIPEGLPVVATASDKAVEALGSGLIREGSLGLVSLGTYIPAMVNGDSFKPRTANMFSNLASMPHRYLYESTGIWRGMWLVSWFRDLLGKEVTDNAAAEGLYPEQYLDRLAETVPAGSEGLMVVPEWLNMVPYKKGIMMGFDVRHGRAHIYRAILEGIALTMKNNYDRMCGELGFKPEKIIVSGGGSNSDVFVQIFADVFGVPAIRNRINGAASIGSAICAAVAVGAYGSFEEAVDNMVVKEREFEPIPENVKLYAEVNETVYRDLTGATDQVLEKSYPFFN